MHRPGPPRVTSVGERVELAPRDPEPGASYSWSIVDGPASSSLVVEDGPVVDPTPDVPGTYRVRLAASDGHHDLTVRAFPDERRTARFALEADDLPVDREAFDRISVAGNFNDWLSGRERPEWQTAGERGTDQGAYVYETRLQPGTYRYRFLADDRWEDDAMAGDELTVPGPGRPRVHLTAERRGDDVVVQADASPPPDGEAAVAVEFLVDDRDDLDRAALDVDGELAALVREEPALPVAADPVMGPLEEVWTLAGRDRVRGLRLEVRYLRDLDRVGGLAVERLDVLLDRARPLVSAGVPVRRRPGLGRRRGLLRLLAVAVAVAVAAAVALVPAALRDVQTARERDVAMVFQNYALYPHKTVQQNMAFGLRMSTDLSKDARVEKVREAAEMMGIEELLQQKPDELSGGQKQRVALGRTIVREPSVFLFDEPLSNLDAKLRTSMRAEIQRLQNELGITAIYVTHDQEEAMTMGDRIVVLRDGELQQVGSPRDVYEHPANRFVAGFIGSPSMNFLEVEFTGDGTLTDGRNFDYRLSEEYVDGLDVEPGETVVAGIRPEHVRPADGGGQTVDATVEVAEPVGSDNYLYLDVGEEFVARVDTDVNPEPGETIAVTFDEDMLRLFDDETGAILGYGALGVDAPEVRP